ncbi:MAG: hypothetical protein IPH84_08365 [Bacteroidales bacterium]|nr:hypothetical protein [Bacteroidales bacterium]
MKQLFWFLMILLMVCSGQLVAQSPTKVTIKSMIRDTSNAEVPFATVMLLTPKDSTLVNLPPAMDPVHFHLIMSGMSLTY